MKFLLVLLLLVPIITKKGQALSEALKRNTDIQEGLSHTDAHVKKREVHRPYCILLQEWNESKGNLQLQIGNAIFLHNLLTLQKNFQDDVQKDCHAEIMEVNFCHPKEAEKKINNYVKNKTEGKIQDVLKDLSKDTKMVLVNYVVLKGEWQKIFHPDNTYIDKFFVDENTMVDVPMMHITGLFNIYYDTDLPCTVVELPYKDDASMIVAMPESGKIHELERGINAKTIQRWRTLFTEMSIQLSFPKFSIKSTIDMEKPLCDFGIKTNFADSADFSRIPHNVGLKAGKVVRSVKITVDEKGTEVAGTTILEAIPRSLPTQALRKAEMNVDEKRMEASVDATLAVGPRSAPITVNFNRQFLLAVDVNKIDCSIFMDTVANPKE